MTKHTPKKILYLITKSNFGGAQKYVYELAQEAKKRGFSTTVACGGTGTKQAKLGKLADMLQAVDISVVPVKHFMRDISFLEEIKAFFEVIGILRKERPDVFHVTSSKAGGLGALAGRLTGVKRIVFTSHGLTIDETWRPKWQIILISFFTWLTILLSHHTIMISTETYNRVRQMPWLSKRVSLIFNGIAKISFMKREEVHEKLFPTALPDNAVVIGGIGELHPNKNWHSLVQAMSSLPETVYLLIIGEGEERLRLEGRIKELKLEHKVYLSGYVDEAPRHIKAWDIFVLPSKKEGLPYVLLEAGLAGLPVIASDLPGNHDIIKNGETGLLIKPEPDTLAESLNLLINDRGMRDDFGERLHSSVVNKFSIKNMQAMTFNVY